MVAKMNRIENAARLAMADVGGEATAPAAQPRLALAVKVGLLVAFLTLTGLLAATLL